jgi:superfamily II DNA/RNA helicase
MDAMIKMLKNKVSFFPMFIYFNSTKRCKEFYEKSKKKGLNIDYLDGKSSISKRNDIKKRLCEGKLDIVVLCGVYNEGVSIDNIRTVMFGDLRHSEINKIQIMMRACRLHKSKPFYRIIIPMHNDDINNIEIKDIVRTFYKIDSQIRKSVKNKSKTKIKIDNIDDEKYEEICDNLCEINEEKAELKSEKICDSSGNLIDKDTIPEIHNVNVLESPGHMVTKFKCSVCDKIYNYRKDAKLHIKRNDCKDKEYHCFKCNNRYDLESSLTRHIRTKHSEIDITKFKSKFECKKCGRYFKYNKNLKYHIKKVKCLDKKFNCPKCVGLRYAEKRSLMKHIQLKHPCENIIINSPAKPTKIINEKYKSRKPENCIYCNKTYANKYVLKIM